MPKKKPDKDKPVEPVEPAPEVVEPAPEEPAIVEEPQEPETNEPAPEPVAPAPQVVEPEPEKTPTQLLSALRTAVKEARKGGYAVKVLATYNYPIKGGETTRL